MATLSNILLDKEILLESGTNELEVLVFDVADYTFGINVAKVREVLPIAEITKLPRAHSSIRGVFRLRNQVIPCVSLLDHLGIRPTKEVSESTMILTDLNQQQTAFLVDQVERIHRLSWENILAVPGLEALSHTPVTALARCENRLVVMLDFEMILDDVTEQYFRTDEVDNPLGVPRDEFRILLAEDSPTVREAIEATLRASGYTKLTFFENGAQAWGWIDDQYRRTQRADEVADLLIADVEMPQVDGFHLTKRMKDHPELKNIPVMLYSSIITPDNRKKGAAVGADAQVAKPELGNVVQLADKLISDARNRRRGGAIQEIVDSCRMPASGEPAPAVVAPAAAVSSVATRAPESPAPKPVVEKPVAEAPVAAKPAEAPVAAPAAPKPAVVSESKPSAAPPAAPASSPVAQAPAASKPVEKPAAVPPAPPVAQAAPIMESNDHLGEAGEEVPTGVNPNLWRTFHRELTGRATNLRDCTAAIERTRCTDDLFHEVARTLHTIKSAAMVVPIEVITRCTHHMESLLDAARQDRDRWPTAALSSYTTWLETVVSVRTDVDGALEAGGNLEQLLHDQLKLVGRIGP